MNESRHMIAALEAEYRRYKALGDGTFAQLGAKDLLARPTPESLSIAMIVWHISGNLESRFTDFLTSDGEKPWRDRESEFAERRVDRKEMLAKWERGWGVLFAALAPLTDEDLNETVTIRGVSATVGEALERSLAHTSYHVGQITFLGKMLRRGEWKYLSIPPGKSAAYNASLRGSGPLGKGRSPAKGVAKLPSREAREPASKRPAKPAAKKSASRVPKKPKKKSQRRG